MSPVNTISPILVEAIPCSHLSPNLYLSNPTNRPVATTQTKTNITSSTNPKKMKIKHRSSLTKKKKPNHIISSPQKNKSNSINTQSHDAHRPPNYHPYSHPSEPLKINPNLPIRRSDHPLDECITNQSIQHITSLILQAESYQDTAIKNLNDDVVPLVNHLSFTNLLMYGSMTDDSIFASFFSIINSNHPNIDYLDTNFHRTLIRDGWQHAFQTFFLHPTSSNYARQNRLKPLITSPTLIIPIHVHESHWVALVRRIIKLLTRKCYFCMLMT
jgi:hypothetical protein